ncbi:MFS transporter [Acidianus sp. HS-5]|nr:MFS transporter [Acidianus sp. HS-5]
MAMEFHLTSVQIGLVLTLFYVGYVISSTPWGLFIDSHGVRHAILISSLSSSFIILLIFLFPSYDVILISYLLAGFLVSALFPSSVKIVSVKLSPLYFYLGILESSAPFAVLLLSLISGLLYEYWRIFYLLLFVSLLSVFFITLFMEEEYASRKRREMRLLFTKAIILSILVRSGEMWISWGTTAWLFPFLVLYFHFSCSSLIFLLFSLGLVSSTAVSSKLPGLIGEKKVVQLSLFLYILLLFLLFLSRIVWLSFFLGVFSFSFRSPTDSMIVKFAGKENSSSSIGIANTISQVGSLLAPVSIGLAVKFSPVLGIFTLSGGAFLSLAVSFLI